jgi:diguanylate cyclase (GGDEF)-like protein/PAS domain S-box-containing protein
MFHAFPKYLLHVFTLTVLYVIAAKAGLMLAFEQESTSPVWPPTGLAIAAMLYCGIRIWPGVFLGALIINFYVSSAPLLSFCIAIGNTLEALVASLIVLRFASAQPFFKTSETAVFLIALLIATMLGASIGVSSLLATDRISADNFGLLWKTWWVGDFVGGLVLTPFLLTWLRRPEEGFTLKQLVEGCLLILTTLAALIIAFGNPLAIPIADELVTFTLLPILAWSVLRFQHHGATLVVLIISTGAIIGTVNGSGPFVLANENQSLLALQAYIGAAMFTALLLMASQGERMAVLRILRENEKQLEGAVSRKTQQLEITNELLEAEMRQQMHLSESLKMLLHNIDAANKEDFFVSCTQALCAIYNTSYAFIGVFADKEQTLIKTLAVWGKGQADSNFIYPLKGTPCEDVLNHAMELVPDNVASRYPEDDLLISMGVVSYYGAPLKSASGKVLGIMAVMDNRPLAVSSSLRSVLGLFANRVALEIQRRKAIDELELAASVFRESMEGIIICDADARIVRVNPEFCKISGYAEAEVIGQTPRLFKSGQHAITFYDQLWTTLKEQGFWKGEIINKRKNGEIFISWQLIKAVKDEYGEIQQYISIINDISDKKRSEEKIYRLAHQDLITQLPNRMSFQNLLKDAVNVAMHSTNRLAVMFIDLDHFKLINDTSGHPAGDELLQQVAIRLKNIIGAQNVISRFGGDEFTVLLPSIDSTEEVIHVAQQILDSLLMPFSLSSCDITISASIGISLYPDHAQNASTLLSCADNAMYRAKESGRASFAFYTDQMQVDAQERVILERELRRALKEQEFLLHFQPQIDVASQRIVGVEALIRWQHPLRGMIPPDKFIPIAEATGLIVPIGEWVLQEACQQLRLWIDQGHTDLVMAINLSARQFFQKNLLEFIQQVLKRTGVPSANLEFEITESMMMNNVEETIATLNKMKDLGLQLSIDDFGTGYSSLSYLKQFPIHKLKIDKSFVDGLPHDADDLAIVQAIIAISHALHLRVIAEGVETAEQYRLLSSLDCNEIQGYFFSKPLPAEHLIIENNGRWVMNQGCENFI